MPIYTNSHYITTETANNFPCFVQNGAQTEDPNQSLDISANYSIIARNALRHLTYEVSLHESKLPCWHNFQALFFERNPGLLQALRQELQHLFINAYHYIEPLPIQSAHSTQLEMFINTIVAVYPFMDPEQNEIVCLPQKLNHRWQWIEYHFEKIDISPQSGLVASLIEDEDRLYAYGLVPNHNKTMLINENAQPYLLLMGSTYPAGQGALLNWLENFRPGNSVGEGHDLSQIAKWLTQHPHTKLSGHSKGGTLAMIIASKYAQQICEAHCLSPTRLNQETLDRIHVAHGPAVSLASEHKPIINVYTHIDDPVFLFGDDLLPNTRIYQFGESTASASNLSLKDRVGQALIAHIHYFAGHKAPQVVLIDWEQNKSKENNKFKEQRRFINDIKQVLNWLMFLFLYANLIYKLSARKVRHFCRDHAVALRLLLVVVVTGLCCVLLSSGLLTALVLPLYASVSLPIAATLISGLFLAVSSLSSAILPKLIDRVETVLHNVVLAAAFAANMLAGVLVGGLVAKIKQGIRYFKNHDKVNTSAQQDATLESTAPLGSGNEPISTNSTNRFLGGLKITEKPHIPPPISTRALSAASTQIIRNNQAQADGLSLTSPPHRRGL